MNIFRSFQKTKSAAWLFFWWWVKAPVNDIGMGGVVGVEIGPLIFDRCEKIATSDLQALKGCVFKIHCKTWIFSVGITIAKEFSVAVVVVFGGEPRVF